MNLLLTGASGGLGRALARELAPTCGHLIALGRDLDRLALLRNEVSALGTRINILQLDLCDRASLDHALEELPWCPDLVILASGITSTKTNTPSLETAQTVECVMTNNFTVNVRLIEYLAPQMMARGSGQIVAVSSISAIRGLSISPAYCASKAALSSYIDAMRCRYAGTGVDFTLVEPGFFVSPMSDQYPASKPMIISAERAAHKIAKGIKRRQKRVRFPILLGLGLEMLRLLPASLADAILNGWVYPQKK